MVDETVRTQTFLWLQEIATRYNFIVPRKILESGFDLDGQRITLLGPRGIWKPKVCDLPISIASTIKGPYSDGFTEDGLLFYRYQGSDPQSPDNVGLRRLMASRTPFVYFHSVVAGKYVPIWPVFVVRDLPHELAIHAAVDPAYTSGVAISTDETDIEEFRNDSSLGVRRYVASFTRRRLHQSTFRERIIAAYHHTCTICRLQHAELLDAAHIIPDVHEFGEPVVQNGLCLCKIHHAAYDQNIIGISPDYRVHVRRDILAEIDGPMLRHGLQELNGSGLVLPTRNTDYPDPDRLHVRYQEFRNAG